MKIAIRYYTKTGRYTGISLPRAIQIKIHKGRPNQQDLEELKEFVQKIIS